MTHLHADQNAFVADIQHSQSDGGLAPALRPDAAHRPASEANTVPPLLEFRAALLGAVVEALQCATLGDACSMLVTRIQRLLGCRAVAVASIDNSTGNIRLASISPAPGVDRRSSIVAEIENALRETLLLDEVTADPPLGQAVRTAAVSRLRSQWGVESAALAAPLRTGASKLVGSWVVVAEATFFGCERNQAMLAEASATLAASVAALTEQHASIMGRLRDRLAQAVRSRRSALVAGALTTCLLLGLVPWPYAIHCDGVCEPKSQRFVAAPFSSILEKVAVAPGDVVERDSILAQLDGESISTEIATAEAEYQQTRQRYDAALAAGKAGPASVEKLNLAQIKGRLNLLQSRREQLDLRSPVTGVVVSGDLARAVGAPVTLGQALFEVAPLTPMLVEAAIPEADVARVEEGMTADVQFEVESLTPRRGVVERIHPRGEIRDGRNVFIAVISLEEGESELRPGMRTSVHIHAGSRSLAWIALHRPIHAARAALGW